jgi:hypothetical protein
MIPLLATVRLVTDQGRRIRLWIPFLPLLVLLSPLLLPAAVIACLRYRIRVGRALVTGVQVLAALNGTRVAVDDGGTVVYVSFR